jgi:hypothetical protein
MHTNDSATVVTPTDLTLMRAAKVWISADATGLWDTFRPDRREALMAAWDQCRAESIGDAFERLYAEQVAQARPDLSRVHASWWLRALAEEPPSVQRAVASALPSEIAEGLLHGLNLTRAQARPDHPQCPTALQTALALWSERLVGDLAERGDDPAAIVALTRFDSRTVGRMINTVGLAKWSLTTQRPPRLDRLDTERFTLFRAALEKMDMRFVHVAERDLTALDRRGKRPEARLGLITLARLLSAADPHRVRWALQHIPYSTAKAIRKLMGPAPRRVPMLARWEREILRAAWEMLHLQGRVTTAWEDPA